MIKKILPFVAATLVLLATSCDKESESRYSYYPVSFSCDASIHPYNIVHSYGEYIIITREGASDYKVQWNNDKEMTVRLTAQQAMYGNIYYGLGGLIIGRPSAYDGNIMAFDLACPNCEQAEHKLTVTQPVGHAECAKCGSIFDLNSGGIPIKGVARRPLWQYKVVENNPYIIITN